MKRNRIELIGDLRKHTTKGQLDELLQEPTAVLRGVLAYHESSEADKAPRPAPMKLPERCKHPKDMTLFGFPVIVCEEIPAGFLGMIGLSKKTKKKELFRFRL